METYFTISLATLAALLNLTGYVIYNIQTIRGSSRPNASTWAVWAFIAILNPFTYKEMSGDGLATMQYWAGTIACIATFVFALFKGKYEWPKGYEWICLFLGIVAAIFWWKYSQAAVASMLILSAFLISFTPTLIGVLNYPHSENAIAWIIWTIGFVLASTRLVLVESKLISYVMPVTLLLAHAIVAFLSRKDRKLAFIK